MDFYDIKNPFEIDDELLNIHIKTMVSILSIPSGFRLWEGEKEDSPVSLEIPQEITRRIKEICTEENLSQWEFEKKFFSSLVLDGLMFRYILATYPKVSMSIATEMLIGMRERFKEEGKNDTI